jgi:xanthine dehydrogenase accessory factor
MSLQSQFTTAAVEGNRCVLVTVLSKDESGPGDVQIGSKLLLGPGAQRSGGLGSDDLDDFAVEQAQQLMWDERSETREHGGVLCFFDVTAPPPRLLVFGAVDFAGELCRLARVCGWRAYVIDPRARFATAQRFPDAEDVIVAWPDEAFERAGGIDPATYVAVLTHDPKLDDATLLIALRSDAAYVGAMGSRRAQADRRERLLDKGMHPSELDRLCAPIGLDLGGMTAQETALAIMAEVVAVRNGRGGGRLSQKQGRIHEVGA